MYVVWNKPNRRELHEMSRAQFDHWQQAGVPVFRVTSDYAHKWVRDGEPHMTGLWVDDEGRIRYARPGT